MANKPCFMWLPLEKMNSFGPHSYSYLSKKIEAVRARVFDEFLKCHLLKSKSSTSMTYLVT